MEIRLIGKLLALQADKSPGPAPAPAHPAGGQVRGFLLHRCFTSMRQAQLVFARYMLNSRLKPDLIQYNCREYVKKKASTTNYLNAYNHWQEDQHLAIPPAMHDFLDAIRKMETRGIVWAGKDSELTWISLREGYFCRARVHTWQARASSSLQQPVSHGKKSSCHVTAL